MTNEPTERHFRLVRCGNYWELHRTIITNKGSYEQPICVYSTKRQALEEAKEWQQYASLD